MSRLPPIRIHLRPGRDKSVRRRHPWIFSGALGAVAGPRDACAVAEVMDADGAWLARGLFAPGADLAVRLYTWQEGEALDDAFFARRAAAALERRAAWRKSLPAADAAATDSYRLVFAEADDLSGLIIDRYAGTLSAQLASAALLPFLGPLLEDLRLRAGASAVTVRADPDAVAREGLDPSRLAAWPAPAAPLRIRENGLLYDVDLGGGQKTGFFLDQRDNRRRVAAWAAGRRVLSAYCYTGGFELNAARAGAAEILGLDASEAALERARAHVALNNLALPVAYEKSDVPHTLRRLRDAGRAFDLIVLDPPRFVFNQAQKEKGLRAYKDINLQALRLLSPGGILATFSCSGLVSAAEFSRMLAWAAADVGREVRILDTLGQPPDHPVLVSFPESEYLKGVIARVE